MDNWTMLHIFFSFKLLHTYSLIFLSYLTKYLSFYTSYLPLFHHFSRWANQLHQKLKEWCWLFLNFRPITSFFLTDFWQPFWHTDGRTDNVRRFAPKMNSSNRFLVGLSSILWYYVDSPIVKHICIPRFSSIMVFMWANISSISSSSKIVVL